MISIVSNSYYGMPRGQIHIYLPPGHPIMSFETIEIKMAAVSGKGLTTCTTIAFFRYKFIVLPDVWIIHHYHRLSPLSFAQMTVSLVNCLFLSCSEICLHRDWGELLREEDKCEGVDNKLNPRRYRSNSGFIEY